MLTDALDHELPGDKDNNFLSPRRFYTEEDRYLDEKWLNYQGATKLNIVEAPFVIFVP